MPIRRSPCELFIRSLVCQRRYTNERIREEVRGLDLDYLGEPHIERMRRSCTPPNPFYPRRRSHGPSKRFLIQEGLYPLFYPGKDMEQANYLLHRPQAKEVVESSLISRLGPEWIAAMLRRQGIQASPKAVTLYKRFYFDIDHLDSASVSALIAVRSWAEDTDDPDEKALAHSLANARRGDPRKLAARNGVSPLGGVLHQMRYGILPSTVELSQLASAARTAATIQVLDSALSGQAERSRDFALVAKTMTEMLETVGNPEEELQASLRQLALKTDRTVIPTVHQLTEGRHTTDLQPIGEQAYERKSGDT